MRLCEAQHFNESRQRHYPALAAAAETPALPQLLPPSPSPAAAPQPRSPGRAQPGEDSTRRRPRARPQRPPAASLRGPVRGLPWLGKGAAGRAGRGPPPGACRARSSCSRRAPKKPGAWRAGRAPPSARRRRRRHPARRSSKGAALPRPDWPRPGAVCTGGSGAAGTCLFCLVPPGLKRGVGRAPPTLPARLFATLLVEMESQGGGAGRGVCHCQNWPRSEDQVCAYKEWPGQASYCVCAFPCAREGGVLEDGAICAWWVAAVWVLQVHLQGLKFLQGQRGCLMYKLVPAVLKACGEEMAFSS